MPVIWHTATLKSKNQHGSNTFYLNFEVSSLENYQPGRFITFDLPIGTKRLDRWRSYSIASIISTHEIQLCIVAMTNGIGSKYLCHQLGIGETLSFKGPEGNFILQEDFLEVENVFLCTGTGVAPFKAMIEHVVANKKNPRLIHLIFGTREEKDILYRDYFEHIQKTISWFKYDIVLSREANWSGYKGHIHEVYETYYCEAKNDRKFYLCGWQKMIDEAVEKISVFGYDKSQIIFELYG